MIDGMYKLLHLQASHSDSMHDELAKVKKRLSEVKVTEGTIQLNVRVIVCILVLYTIFTALQLFWYLVLVMYANSMYETPLRN